MSPSFRSKALFRFSGQLPVRTILKNNRPYIERYYVGQAFGWTFYLHRYLTEDKDRGLHSHPWPNSVGVPLVGGYSEERMVAIYHPEGPMTVVRNIFFLRPNFIGRGTFHKILSIHPGTWTLFAHKGKAGRWGFIDVVPEVLADDGNPIWGLHPADPPSGKPWWPAAPLGKDSDRLPL